MSTVRAVAFAALMLGLQSSFAADDPAIGARRVEDAQPSAAVHADQAAPASSVALVAGRAQFFSHEDTRTVLLSSLQRARTVPANVRPRPARGQREQPAPAAKDANKPQLQPREPTQKTSPNRTSRNVRLDAPKVTVVNPSPYFRFIQMSDRNGS